MNIFKRWTASVSSRVDWMVSQVENQEALVNSALKEARQSAARAKVQLGRVRRDGEVLRSKHRETEQAVIVWRERAVKANATDEAKALECLRRSKRAEQQQEQVRRRLDEHEQIEQQLAKDVNSMEEQLAALVEKRNLMRTRQSRAEAVQSIQGGSESLATDLDDIFERWETRVTEKEIAGACSVTTDSFEESFATSEEDDSLRAELAQLTGSVTEEVDHG